VSVRPTREKDRENAGTCKKGRKMLVSCDDEKDLFLKLFNLFIIQKFSNPTLTAILKPL
jgi:hypothetical protein